jgi:hypothetical protein
MLRKFIVEDTMFLPGICLICRRNARNVGVDEHDFIILIDR